MPKQLSPGFMSRAHFKQYQRILFTILNQPNGDQLALAIKHATPEPFNFEHRAAASA